MGSLALLPTLEWLSSICVPMSDRGGICWPVCTWFAQKESWEYHQFNSLLISFHTGHYKFTVFVLSLSSINCSCKYTCFHSYYSWYHLLCNVCPAEIGKDLAIISAPPKWSVIVTTVGSGGWVFFVICLCHSWALAVFAVLSNEKYWNMP